MADYRDASYSNQNQMGWGEDFNQDPVDNSDGKMLSRESRTGTPSKITLLRFHKKGLSHSGDADDDHNYIRSRVGCIRIIQTFHCQSLRLIDHSNYSIISVSVLFGLLRITGPLCTNKLHPTGVFHSV
jgi:hypothetical protein